MGMAQVGGEVIEDAPAEASADAIVETGWSWDEGIPGEGERPEWLKGKYGKVVDQAKAYIQAEKAIGNSAAPESYDLTGYEDYLDLESEHISELTNFAKEHRLSQEALSGLIDPLRKYHDSQVPNVDVEIEKLGKNAQARINTVNTWATNHLSEKSMETLGQIGTTAAVIEMMDEIRQIQSQTQSQVPANMTNHVKRDVLTYEEVEAKMLAEPVKYRTDPNFRQEISHMFSQVLGEE